MIVNNYSQSFFLCQIFTIFKYYNIIIFYYINESFYSKYEVFFSNVGDYSQSKIIKNKIKIYSSDSESSATGERYEL
jgi:hypothetical protein